MPQDMGAHFQRESAWHAGPGLRRFAQAFQFFFCAINLPLNDMFCRVHEHVLLTQSLQC